MSLVLIISGSSSNMVGIGSKSRSLCQILLKSCELTSGHSFDPIFLKLPQNVCLDDISVKFDHVWGGVKKQVTRSNLTKNLVYALGAKAFVAQSSSNLLRMFILMIYRPSLIMGEVGSKSRSLGQILETSCLCSRGQIFGPHFLKLAQDVYTDYISVRFDNGWVGVNKQITRSNLRKILFTLQGPHFWSNLPQTCSECLSRWYLGQV